MPRPNGTECGPSGGTAGHEADGASHGTSHMRHFLEDWTARHREAIEQLTSQVQRLETMLDTHPQGVSQWRAALSHASFPSERIRGHVVSGSQHSSQLGPRGYVRHSTSFSSLFDKDEAKEYKMQRRSSLALEQRNSFETFIKQHSFTPTDNRCLFVSQAISPWRTPVKRLVHSAVFDMLCATAIIANAVLVGVETEYTVVHIDPPPSFKLTYLVLNGWFVFELLLRLFAQGATFFFCEDWRWNVFDSTLIATSVVDMSVETLDASGLLLGRVLGAVRVFRIIRTVRIVRLLVYIGEFRKMAVSMMASLQTLFWSLVLLFFVLYTFSIWLTQAVSHQLHTNPGARDVEGVEEYYGSLWTTIYTLYQCISTGLSWGYIIRPLFAIDPTAAALFIIFISISFFGVLNIVTSVFVESAMQTTRKYRDFILQDSVQKHGMYSKHLKQIFSTIDTDETGHIRLKELRSFIQTEQPQLRDYFDALEIDATNLHALFKLLDHDGTGTIDINEFCDGCMRLKGEARSFDLNCLIYENRRFHKRMVQHMQESEERTLNLTSLVGSMAHDLRLLRARKVVAADMT